MSWAHSNHILKKPNDLPAIVQKKDFKDQLFTLDGGGKRQEKNTTAKGKEEISWGSRAIELDWCSV